MAAGKKNASRLKATIGFLDESGLLMAPLVRRTWAPRGQTPILRQRTSSRDKVSMIATLMVSPRRRRVRLDTALMVNANVDAECLVEYLRALLRHLRGPLILGLGSAQRASRRPRQGAAAPPPQASHRTTAALRPGTQPGRGHLGLPQAQPARQPCRRGCSRLGAHRAGPHPPRRPATVIAAQLHPWLWPASTAHIGH